MFPDSLSWDVAKLIINTQQNIAIISISVLVGVSLLIIGANIFLIRRDVMRLVNDAKRSMKGEIERIGSENKQLEERIKGDIDKKIVEMDKKMTHVDGKMAGFDAEKSRLFALANQQMKAWKNSATWWALAIEGYAKIKEENLLRIAVDALNWVLEPDKVKSLENEDKEKIKRCLPFIPEILMKEKEQIEDRLKKLPIEAPKQTETK